MTYTQRAVTLLSFIESMREHKSWCVETHIQKGTYLLQELMGVPLGYQFILYKHGPFSFDFKDELTAFMADLLLVAKPLSTYGPSILPGENSQAFLERHPKTRELYKQQAEFIASRIGAKSVPELERLATALLVTRNYLPGGSIQERAKKINELKPHVPYALAYDAVIEIDRLVEEAQPAVCTSE